MYKGVHFDSQKSAQSSSLAQEFKKRYIFENKFSISICFCLIKLNYFKKQRSLQGRNHGKNLAVTSAMVGRICPPGGDRVKVSENLGVTSVALVNTSL